MSAHRVDLAGLSAVIDSIGRVEAFLVQALEDADRQVNRVHATWSGQAATDHAEAHRRWRQGAGQMHAALGVMRQIAQGAHANYSSAVHANVTMWSL